MNRKEFLKSCGIACVGSSAVITLLQSCTTSNYFAQTSMLNNQLAIKKTEFVNSSNNKITQRKFVLIKSDKYNFPICVYKFPEEQYTALLTECTHNSCEVRPQGDFLICPCHGSEFSNKGVVMNPPAEQNLMSFPIKTDNEYIYIQI